MLPFLPLLVLAALLLVCLGWALDEDHAPGVRTAALQAMLLVGGGLALASEGLSLVHGLTPPAAAAAWALALVLVLGIGLQKSALLRGVERPRAALRRLDRVEWVFLAVMGILLGALVIVAVKSPASTSDSLQYHLARVVHWAQNSSLQHYMTGFRPQLYNPIWAEEAILHLRLLKGDDTLAGLVQWTAFVGVLLAVSQITAQLGGSRRSQLVAAAFAFSLPMGLMQASSTQNDMVVALWLCCVAVFVLRTATRPPVLADSVFLGLAFGLGLLTKGTFYPLAVPFGIAYLAILARWANFGAAKFAAPKFAAPTSLQDRGSQPGSTMGRFIGLAALTGSLAAVLNLGFWLRNLVTFGGPLGSREWVTSMTSGRYDAGAFLVSLVRNVVLNFPTPSPVKNEQIEHFLIDHLGFLDSRLEEFVMRWGWNLENQAGNPLHIILITLAMIGLLVFARGHLRQLRLGYLLAVGGVTAMLAWIIPPDRWGIRYQVPVFMVGAPLVGLLFDRSEPSPRSTPRRRFPAAALAALAFLVMSLPWVLFNRTRPLIALKEAREPFSLPLHGLLGNTLGSVLFEPPETLLFAYWPDYRDPYIQLASDIQASGCRQIGLRIDSGDPEYLFWWLLDAPQSGVRIESIYSFPELERYADPAFEPCAVLCTVCGDRARVHGLPRIGQYANVGLFLGSGFHPDPDG